MKNKKIRLQITALTHIFISSIACGDVYAALESDVINNAITTNFDFISNNDFSSTTYTKNIESTLQTHKLGFYGDFYGRTIYNYLKEGADTIARTKRCNRCNNFIHQDTEITNFQDILDINTENKPNSLYLYNIDNKTPLVDYYLDATNSTLLSFFKDSHLGAIESKVPNAKRIKYQLKITEHLNSLFVRNSNHIKLGLGFSLNVYLENSTPRLIQNTDGFTIPVNSILTTSDTILHGNTSEANDKCVYLKIYYT